MLHKGVRFAYLVIMCAAAAMSFIVMRNFDEAAVSGPSYVVKVNASDSAAGNARVTEMVTSLARDRRANIGRLTWDTRNESYRHIYLAVGDPHAASTGWLADGYPNFSRNARTDMRPYREIGGTSPAGYYLVYGPQPLAAELLDRFASLGYAGRIDPLFSLRHGLEYFGRGALLWCFLIVALTTVLSVASAIILNARSYGIQRLQGRSFGGILRRDLAQLATFVAGTGAGLAAVTLGLLYAYNRLHQVGTYLLVALSFLGVFAAIALITHVLTLAVAHRQPVLSAIQGEVGAAWLVAGSYGIRISAILLTVSISTAAIASGLAVRQAQARNDAWAGADRSYYMLINGGYGGDQERSIYQRIGQWIRGADTRGEAILAAYIQPPAGPAAAAGPGPDREILVVNNRYLDKHPLYDAAGGRVRPAGGNTVRVLIPRRYAGQTSRIADTVTGWLDSSAGSHGAPVPPTRIEQTRDRQAVFSYGSALSGHNLVLEDPVVVVVTGASGVISDGDYMALATQRCVVFDDPDRAMTGLAASGLAPYVLGMSPLAQEAADGYRDARREFGLQLFNLIAAVAVLLITALNVSIVYCRKNAQALFVKHISGWGFVRTHRGILAVESGLALALVLWTWERTRAVLDTVRDPMAPPRARDLAVLAGWQPAVATVVALLSLTLIAISLARTNARFVKAHSASLA